MYVEHFCNIETRCGDFYPTHRGADMSTCWISDLGLGGLTVLADGAVDGGGVRGGRPRPLVDRILSVVLRGVSHEGRLIDRGA